MGELAAHDLHKCRFACPVSADKADPLPPLDLEGNPVEKLGASKGDPYLLQTH
jgi:hypothetical protein